MSKVHFYRETKFKKTEIGEIPEGWEIKKIKDIFKVLTGTTPSTKNPIYWNNGKINWFTPEDLSNEQIFITNSKRKITNLALKDYNLKLLTKGDILISTRAPVGYVSIIQTQGVFNQGCKGLKPKENVDTLFYLYYLRFIRKFLETLSGGSTFKELPKKALENIKIPLPPLEEQKAIANVLKDFDDLIEVIDKKIETYKRIKKKLMEIYFTRGVFEHKTFKDTEIGRIPEGWEVKKVSSLLEKAISAHGIKENEIKSKGKYPVVNQGKTFIVGFSDNTDFLINKNLPLVLFGDHTCEVKYIDFPFIVAGEGVKLLKPLESVDVIYFYYVLEKFKPKQEQYRRHFRILKEKLIPLPPLEEQKEIAKRLKAIDDQIENLKKQKEHLQKVKKKFMDLLLTGKLRIKIN
ncbi:MAG: restriction endonuclease subunit S [Aquificota bacterium]